VGVLGQRFCDGPHLFFVNVADKGLTLAGAEVTVDSSQLTARDSGGGKVGSGEEVITGRMAGQGSPVGPAPSPSFFVSVADKGVMVTAVRGGQGRSWSGRTSLSGSTGETDRVGFNTECTEFTEDERRGWMPPTRGCPQVMK
jgi:hypothetical protein